MIPSRFEVISEIPLLSSGKIDRKRLPEPIFQKDLSENKTIGDTNIEISPDYGSQFLEWEPSVQKTISLNWVVTLCSHHR